jgi:uncharacterized membrane protein (DUF4010 family)
MIASTVALVRVLVEIAVVAPATFPHLAPPLALLAGWMALLAVGVYYLARGEPEELPPPGNPAELTPALVFGGLYALVLWGVAAAKDLLGETGLYGIAILSGLLDLDAITLSTAQLVDRGRVEPRTGWRLILVATLSNLVFKGCLVAVLGHRRLLGWVAVLFGAALAGGLVLLLGTSRFC